MPKEPADPAFIFIIVFLVGFYVLYVTSVLLNIEINNRKGKR